MERIKAGDASAEGMSRRSRAVLLGVLLAAAALTFGFIFANSLTASEDSWRVSNAAGSLLGPVLHGLYGTMSGLFASLGSGIGLSYEAFVRKAAHFCEYFLLGAECAGVSVAIAGKARSPYLWASLFVPLAIAVADEFAQSFVGRTSLVTDVLLDFSGAFAGFVVVVAVAAACIRFGRARAR